MTDERIIIYLQSGEATLEDAACQFLYQQYFGLVESLVVKNRVDVSNTKDIFQDSVVVLWKMVNKKGFQLTSTIKTLLYSIAYNQLRNKRKQQGRTMELKPEHNHTLLEEPTVETIIQNEKNKLISQLIKQLGTDCQKVLQLFYFQKWSMKKIQTAFGDKSDAVTKNRKSRCLHRLREQVLGNAQLVADLK